MANDKPLRQLMQKLRRAFASSGPVPPATLEQAAALVWRPASKKKVEVLLLTSRGTGRWVLPKGWIESDESTASTAAREAWEEAGVKGDVVGKPIGTYLYDKIEEDCDPVRCHVTVHAMELDRQAKSWPEQDERSRKWVSATEAATMVEEAELAALLEAFGTGWKKLAA